MAMSYKNWKSSVDKWKRIIWVLERHKTNNPNYNDDGLLFFQPSKNNPFRESVIVRGPCGFCEEFSREEGDNTCEQCPLYELFACANNHWCTDYETIFWLIDDMLVGKEWKQALEKSREMLKAIESIEHEGAM